MKRTTLLFLVLFSFTLAAQQPQAQFKPLAPSQKASVMQTIGVTDITITYHRPAVKGRTIFAPAPASMEERAKGEAIAAPTRSFSRVRRVRRRCAVVTRKCYMISSRLKQQMQEC